MRGSRRKRIAALSMDAGLDALLFDASQRERLDAVVAIDADPWTGADVEVLITGWGAQSIGPTELERMPSLRIVVHSGGTVRSFLHRDVWERGIVVTTASGANALPVAEFTLAAILFAGKGVLPIAATYADRADLDLRDVRYASIGNFSKVIGVVGASQIGRRVIELLRSFDFTVLVSDPFLDGSEARSLGVQVVELDELFRLSDIVSLHAPLMPSTVGMVSAPLLASMPPGATLINTARAGLVDQAALVRRLRAGEISAVLDVTDPEPLPTDHPLRHLPNAFLTPHLAGAQGNELRRLGECVVREIEALGDGRPPRHPFTLDDLERSA